MSYIDGYDDDDEADRRASRVLRRYSSELDKAKTAVDFAQATDRLISGLAQARATHEDDNN